MAGYENYNFQSNLTYAMNSGNTNTNKVYINPNFNQRMVPNNGVMHVNPKFSQITQNYEQTNAINQTKVYINPNFIRSNHTHDSYKSQSLNVKKHDSVIVNNTQNLANFRPSSHGLNPNFMRSNHTIANTQSHTPLTANRHDAIVNNIENLANFRPSSHGLNPNFMRSNHTIANTQTHTPLTANRHDAIVNNIENLANFRPLSQPISHNYIRSNNTLDTQSHTSVNVKKLDGIIVNNIENLANSRKPLQIHTQTSSSLPTLINNSRYSFVRRVENKPKDTSVPERVTKTFKIGKYKSVPLSEIKKEILSVKSSSSNNVNKHAIFNQTRTFPLPNNKSSYPSATAYINKYKFVNLKHTPSPKNMSNMKNLTDVRSAVLMNKKRKLILRTKQRIAKRSLKKNNIPCPLFKKFGKCIRSMNGTCELLHDKKHVSICRKFVKGICHDKECLLSHDLTAKKMPTCYFYLKGMCTKEGCPYLHVKLNEKSKICTDFLKGYCEKGNKCLNRHINADHDKASKIPSRNWKSYKIALKSKEKTKLLSNTNQAPEHKGNGVEQRYYQDYEKDESSNNGICEVIKPSRCKLGSLPSFIQL